MPIYNHKTTDIKSRQPKTSTWIGVIFGVWLSSIFSATLTGSLLFRNKNAINFHGSQDSKLNMALLLIAILWPLLYFIFSKHRFLPSAITRKSLIALIIFLFFSILSSFFSSIMLTSTLYWLLTVFSIFICLQFISALDFESLELGLKFYAIALTLEMLGFSVWEYVPGIRLGEAHRILEPALIGMICLSATIAAMAFKWKLIRFSLIFILICIIYLTGSRAPMLATIFGISTAFYYRTLASEATLKLTVIFGILLGIAGLIVFTDDIIPVVNNFLGIHDKHRGLDSGGSGRLGIWQETWKLFLENPAFGVGFRAHEARLTLGSSSHNGYLAMLAEIGLVGFLAIFYIIVLGVFKLKNILRQSKDNAYIFSMLIGICYSYLFLAIFERYLINSGNPTSILFLISILWPQVISKSTRSVQSISGSRADEKIHIRNVTTH